MLKKSKVETPEDVLEAVIFRAERFNPKTISEYENRGYQVRCITCHDLYDPTNPEAVEMMQLTATVIFNFQTEDGILQIPHPWTALYCKHCIMALFGNTDISVQQMYQ